MTCQYGVHGKRREMTTIRRFAERKLENRERWGLVLEMGTGDKVTTLRTGEAWI